MFRVCLTLALICVTDAVVKGIEDRVQGGECASQDMAPTSFFGQEAQIGQLPSEPVAQHEASVVAANLISIEYFSNFKVVTEKMAKEQYILWQCGTSKPTDADVDKVASLGANYTRKYFKIPLQTVMAESTVQLAFLNILDVDDRVMHLTKYAVAPCWQKALDCGAEMIDTYAGGTAEDLKQQRDGVDAVFMDCHWDGTCGNVNTQANAIHISASQDPGPLHSAEHVKFVAAFFNKDLEATNHVASMIHRYTHASTDAAKKPVVAWISYSPPSEWAAEEYKISLATYKTLYVDHAGGKNVDAASLMAAFGDKATKTDAAHGSTITLPTANFGGKEAAAAALFEALADVDVIIDETYAYDPSSFTYDNFLANMNLAADSSLKFIADKKVLRTDGMHGPPPNNAWDWLESRIAHPDRAVEGLSLHLHGDLSKRAAYFRNIATGETPAVLTASMCKEELPACSTNTSAIDIPMLMAKATTTALTSSQEDASGSSRVAFAAPLLFVQATFAWLWA